MNLIENLQFITLTTGTYTWPAVIPAQASIFFATPVGNNFGAKQITIYSIMFSAAFANAAGTSFRLITDKMDLTLIIKNNSIFKQVYFSGVSGGVYTQLYIPAEASSNFTFQIGFRFYAADMPAAPAPNDTCRIDCTIGYLRQQL